MFGDQIEPITGKRLKDLSRDEAEALAGVYVLANILQDFAGSQVTDDAIAQFCAHCDRREHCSADNQKRWVGRDFCGWSERNNVRLGKVTLTTLTLHGQSYRRDQLSELDQVIAADAPSQ